ncbi:hypothetical protein [Caballeronia sp. Lep1P3]|uniref:hypothetical protein n=1 Tax=Caballeronia sp. Lep1P3 TaxID=2878150 RepID=UPI001FD62C18|nr:hypothetical protein [Caballeronia sp. Lep1P3]
MNRKSLDDAKGDIGTIEKAVLTLVNRPRLIRREYWRSEVERLLGGADITIRDRQRLLTLHDLLGDVVENNWAHAN